jgi:hypothetical protein
MAANAAASSETTSLSSPPKMCCSTAPEKAPESHPSASEST